MARAATTHFHTTIKVSSDVRDRLKVQATAGGRTLGEQIDHLIALGDRKARMDGFAADVAAMTPDELASYREEVEFWDAVSGG